MSKIDYFNVIKSDFEGADKLIDAGLISEQNAERYAIRKRFNEIKTDNLSIREASFKLSEEFAKSEHSIRVIVSSKSGVL